MRDLLFLTHRLPYPPNKGDKIRSWHMLQYLSRHFRVHLGCFIDQPDDWQYTQQVSALCASSRFVALQPLHARWRAALAALAQQSMSVHYYRDARLQAWVDGVLAGASVRHGLAFSGAMAQYLDGGAACALTRVIDFVDVDSDKWRQYADSKPWPLSLLYRREAQALLHYERHIARQFTASCLVSPAEAELLRQCAPMARRKVHHVANGVDASHFSPDQTLVSPYAPGAQVMVFTGAMDYWPNIDAVQWLVRHAWPALRRQFPALQLYIVGSRPSAAVRALARIAGVVVTGAVDDVRPYLAGAALAVAPLRIARGVQNKVLEAMAMGKIVLASPQALEGIAARPEHELLLARDEAEFIHQAARVLRQPLPARWNKPMSDPAREPISEPVHKPIHEPIHGPLPAPLPAPALCNDLHAIGVRARQLVLRHHDWQRNLQALGSLLDVAGAAPRPEAKTVANAVANPAAIDTASPLAEPQA